MLSLLLSASAFAGTSEIPQSPPPAAPQQDTWNWFVGGTGGYLLDADEDIYTFQLGANSPWSISGWSVALFAEAGWTENHDSFSGLQAGSNTSLDIVPITFNVKLEHLISGGLSAYVGGGLGTSYVEGDFASVYGGSKDDWVFTAQVFAGLAYRVNENLEIFGGARWLYLDDPGFAGVSLGDDVSIEGGLRFHF